MSGHEEIILKTVRDADRGRRNLTALAGHLGVKPFSDIIGPIARLLPRTADPDMALNNLERLFAQPVARQQLSHLLESRARGLDAVLQLLATSQFFADTLTTYPEFLDSVRAAPRRSPSTAELTGELRGEVDACGDEPAVLRAFRRFRNRHTLRIGINDVIRDRPLEEVTRELARVADSSIEVALQHAMRTVGSRFGTPTGPEGEAAQITALAFGKLGGDELNYSSDIDLMFVYDHDGETVGRRTGVSNGEFFTRVVQDVVRILHTPTDRGFAYRVDLRLRPEGNRGPLARSMASTLSYYDTMGRTWERQALIKLRHVAGNAVLAREFVRAVEPFVYRKYFSFAEINEVKALKRQMEQRAGRTGPSKGEASSLEIPADVKTGRGGIRDIEYTVQFLQLLNGGDLPAVRQRNTLLALESLEIAGCLTPQETYILSDAYRFLRKTEHRLQLLFDLHTHKLPAAPEELRKLALRMGYAQRSQEPGIRSQESDLASQTPDTRLPAPDSRLLTPQKRSPLDEYESAPPAIDTRDLLVDPLDQFIKDLQNKTNQDRIILNHLLHQTFADAGSNSEPEADLILDPDPDEATVRSVLGRYPFKDVPKAFTNLSQLARESVPFLSARRCRHFLASIAPQLLRAVAETPDPDEALTQLERVSVSLGAKAVLWELFSVNPPSLKLYVDLCAGSPFLSGLLINNPGMIDELLDSLVLDQPRTAEELRAELAELCRGASDPDPILHSFQDKEFLRIGVGDLLGKVDVRQTTAALSDVADTVLNQVVELVEPEVRSRWGNPRARNAECGTRNEIRGEETLAESSSFTPNSEFRIPNCRYALLGLGKLGGREISYHSDLDLLLVYEVDGTTDTGESNAQFFTELAQKIIRTTSRMGPMGRLYAVDMRLRPTGKSGNLVLPLAEFHRYFSGSGCQLWERQSLSRARVVRGDAAFATEVTDAIRTAMLGKPWCPELADEIRGMRQKLEVTANPRSLKRGPGGIVDVEFVVQLLQLKYGPSHPDVLKSNVWDSLDSLETAGLLPPHDATALRAGYAFLRLVEARLRIVTDRPLTEIPENAGDLAKLAHRLGFDSPGKFLAEMKRITADVRARYQAITTRERGS
ncbi:MAG: bifunctional [glutamate--ammonia ligase]-adenylyl-L-tyrosine phosphorylase/[glutamate--ammonia-ligase] adenylyltransferase [Planctomycetaceae bacterium]|nr:bifunctional [glutamate--ammonia ligase]-adenylyl-L-tyrosine phosphorylase/[glutamate--ammonia-ligase] adenylyltransferase [Planctomycetaceae bacterium]